MCDWWTDKKAFHSVVVVDVMQNIYFKCTNTHLEIPVKKQNEALEMGESQFIIFICLGGVIGRSTPLNIIKGPMV